MVPIAEDNSTHGTVDGTVLFSLPKNQGRKLTARASKEAAAALRFLPTLVIPEGRLAGKKLKLAKFQKDFVRGAFAKGTSVACLSIGRGNAKTALSAGIALGHLLGVIEAQPKREIIF
jgi:phage terminase large subunit-like protein